MQTIGERIKQEREKRSWSRRTLALKTKSAIRPQGYTEQSIINWEKDLAKPTEKAIRALEKALSVKLRS